MSLASSLVANARRRRILTRSSSFKPRRRSRGSLHGRATRRHHWRQEFPEFKALADKKLGVATATSADGEVRVKLRVCPMTDDVLAAFNAAAYAE
jgi:hypothetical protein